MKKSRLIYDKISYIILLIIGCLFSGTFGLFAIMTIGDAKAADDGFLEFCIAVTVIGIALIVWGILKKRLVDTYKRYMKVLDSNPDAGIKDIAVLTNSTQESVRKNIEKMIAKNYVAQDTFTIKEKIEKKFVTVQCQGCGAKNVVEEGKHQECEYCGSVLYGE